MITERDWYGRDWKLLRTQLVKLCLLYSAELLAGLQSESSALNILLDSFMERVIHDINERVALDKLGLWQNCLPLLIQSEWLQVELDRDMLALCGHKRKNKKPVQPRQALARKLTQFFEMNRRIHIANDLGVSSNKVKTWERLDRISRKISRKSNISRRCTEEHFDELANYIKANHGHDKNLPRRAKTVKDYFYRFSDDCIENIENRNETVDRLSLQEAKFLLQDVGMAELTRCVQKLSAEDLEIIDVSYRLGISKVIYRTIDDYLYTYHLDHEAFEIKKKLAIDNLRQCLELGLTSRQGGHA